jgi:4-hydroxy-3-methylbut-2-en-1-yl diphosphate reductase
MFATTRMIVSTAPRNGTTTISKSQRTKKKNTNNENNENKHKTRLIVRGTSESEQQQASEGFDPREYRRQLGKSNQYTRKFLNDPEAKKSMEDEGIGYSLTGLVAKMKSSGFTHVEGDVTVRLADSYGFCWGVERAVQMCYEARKQYPTEKMWITNEIIHNPTVNMRLSEMGVNFIEEKDGVKNFAPVGEGEVVVLPAFGASIHEMKLLAEKGVSIVDTTCPWVSKVWNAVDTHSRKQFTSIIHGKYAHEETVATVSFAKTYLVVKDMKEASWVCDYILNGTATKAEFMEKFKNAHSVGFDPEKDLASVGVANQTTMLKGETEAIGKLFERTMMEKHGVQNLGEHYLVTDTICDATQERQDAIYKLVDEKPDIMMIVGGYNSSNTQHLQEISEDADIKSFWVDTADRIDSKTNKISWRTKNHDMVNTENWLPEGKLTIGITSGASTPDKVVEDVLDAIFASKNAMKAKNATAAR